MRTDTFLKLLEDNKEFNFLFKIYVIVPKDELATRSYQYPNDNFNLEIVKVLGNTITFKLVKHDAETFSYSRLKELTKDFTNHVMIKCNVMFDEELQKEYNIDENMFFNLNDYDIAYSEREVMFQVENI